MRRCTVAQMERRDPGPWVKVGERQGWCHGFFQHLADDGGTIVLVEFEDGTLAEVGPTMVTFNERPDQKMSIDDVLWELVTEVRQIKERL